MKNVLLVGYSGFVGNGLLVGLKEEGLNVITCGRCGADVAVDFESFDGLASDRVDGLPLIDSIVFAQGINPSVGVSDANVNHGESMFLVNVIGPLLLIKSLVSKLSPDCSILFLSSIAAEKGSYDPFYASAKSALYGLAMSVSNYLPGCRVNLLSLGLVQGSPVEIGMTEEFRSKHESRMFDSKLILLEEVVSSVLHLIKNKGCNRSLYRLDGGFRV